MQLNEYVQTELETKTKQPSPLNFEEVAALEEELVLIKERYAVIAEEKTMLNKKLNTLREQYNTVCNNSYNKIFFYVAPLVLMVLYLLISAMASWFTAVLCLFLFLFMKYLVEIIKAT